jgi:hypothetical protein
MIDCFCLLKNNPFASLSSCDLPVTLIIHPVNKEQGEHLDTQLLEVLLP